MKQTFKIIEAKAKNIYLDPRSRFFKKRLKSLTKEGYEVAIKHKDSVTLKLKDV